MKAFNHFQSLGKALMLPISVLPAAAILLRFGSPDLLDIPSVMNAGNSIFSNLPAIFAIGIAFGLTKDKNNNGAAGLAGFICYSVLTLNESIDMGIFAGLIGGLTAGFLYNHFYKVKLPEYVGFFGGRRFVPIVTLFAAIIFALIFSLIWPPIQNAIDFIGEFIINSGGLGIFIYGVLNRLLIPFGLHHILNNLVWFVFGEFQNPETGEIIRGDLTRFFEGDPTAGVFMTGGFPIMMFGLPAVALAMYRTAKPENRPKIAGTLASMAFTSFLTGITEPLEFSFMFIAPALYIFHALLYGLSMLFCYESGILMGFGFSPSLIDMILNWSISTNPELIIPIGLLFGMFYYLYFSWMIKVFDLPTLGRYDEEISTLKGDFAAQIVKGLGGIDNIGELDNCATRLRLTVNDISKVDEKFLKKVGVKGIIIHGNAVQIVVGTQVEFIADEIKSMN